MDGELDCSLVQALMHRVKELECELRDLKVERVLLDLTVSI
jgi:hypothetical protein